MQEPSGRREERAGCRGAPCRAQPGTGARLAPRASVLSRASSSAATRSPSPRPSRRRTREPYQVAIVAAPEPRAQPGQVGPWAAPAIPMTPSDLPSGTCRPGPVLLEVQAQLFEAGQVERRELLLVVRGQGQPAHVAQIGDGLAQPDLLALHA